MRGVLRFDPAHPLFKDHFPGAPVIPGTLIIRAFLELAAAHLPDMRIAGIRRFRFLRFAPPGFHSWSMTMERRGPAVDACRLRCSLLDREGQPLAHGCILMEKAAQKQGRNDS